MLLFEIFENEQVLSEYFAANSGTEGKEPLIVATYREVMDRLAGKGDKWYKLDYKGSRKNMTDYLSAIRIDCWRDYFLHVNMPMNYTVSDMADLVREICDFNKSPHIEPALRCTNDVTLAEDEVEITIVVPKYDLGSQLDLIWSK